MISRILYYSLTEPFTWLFYSIFRPVTFARDVERYGIRMTGQRTVLMLRLALPMFTLAMIVRSFLYLLSPAYFSSLDITSLLLIVIANTALGISIGIAIGIAGSITLGLTIGLSLGIALGAANALAGGVTLGITFGLVEGIILGIGENLLIFVAWSVALGVVFGFTGNVVLGITAGTAGGITLGVARGITGNTRESTWFRFIMGAITGSMAGGIVWLISGEIVWRITGGDISEFSTGSIYAAIVFFICYILGYYRLPLYPISCLSLYRAYIASRRKPHGVLAFLKNSSLYWDEYLFLPLPFLKQILLIASRQDEHRELILKEVEFIIAKQRRQITAARAVVLELVLRDLEKRNTVVSIAALSERFAEYVPSEAKPIDPQWLVVFEHLQDACRDAARYCDPLLLSRRDRRSSLGYMLANLEKIDQDIVSRDVTLRRRLSEVVERWKAAILQEQQTLKSTGPLSNPYTVGRPLEPNDDYDSFVGRRDLVYKLEEALGRGNRRPTFFLHGERRMGKSSTLKRLPLLLGSRYIPVTYDLQSPGIRSSAADFLHSVAEGIHQATENRGIQAPKLMELERLQEASKENEQVAYRLLDGWLRDIEDILKRDNRMLLLSFDEFEELGNTHFDVRLLLSWFRNVIQHRPYLALLFSGIHTVSEMQGNWAGYFVNAQTHKVSFLKPEEARKLILEPTPDFPGEDIFGEDVTQEILRVTGCHPFLVQAVCDELIDQLNDSNRSEANVQDVIQVVDRILEVWIYYFQDLWGRTDKEQRTCLFALNKLSECDIHAIMQHCELDERTVRRTLQTLIKRDLVEVERTAEREVYRITTPIFREWVRRNSIV